MSVTAWGVTTFGGPEALHELDVPRENLGAADVRLRVTHAAVNPTDTLRRAGAPFDTDAAPAPGLVPGMDVAGEVLEIGSHVGTGVAVGDRVMGIVVPDGPHGAYRDDLVLPARSVTAVPAGLSGAEAAGIPMNALTARLALDVLALEPGQLLAVTGAAGAFGGFAVQLAKAAGLRVVADAKDSDVELVRSLGADVIVSRGDGVADAIRREFPDGVDGLCDGSLQLDALLPAVRDGGRIATIRGWDGGAQDRVTVTPVWVRDYATEWEKLDEIRALVESGAVTARVADVLPITEVAEAHRRLEAGGVRGRLVLRF